jgi:hypothetical protein
MNCRPYSTRNIITTIKSKGTGWARHVPHAGEMRKFWLQSFAELGADGFNIKMDVKEIGCDGADSINVPQNKV